MQEEFTPLVEDAVALCKNYFAEKLLAIYLQGSIAGGDAVPYISDLDCYTVISEELRPEDKWHSVQMEQELQKKYPIVNGLHLSVHSQKDLSKDKFARFVLKYNSALYFGNDIAAALDRAGYETFQPDAEMAKGRLAFARQCFAQALAHKQPMCTGELPADTYYIARKYARYFVIIEGAYFLMSQNKFASFEKWEVLDKLYQYADHANPFESALDMTREILKDPKGAGITHTEFLQRIRLFVEWMFDRIEKSSAEGVCI